MNFLRKTNKNQLKPKKSNKHSDQMYGSSHDRQKEHEIRLKWYRDTID